MNNNSKGLTGITVMPLKPGVSHVADNDLTLHYVNKKIHYFNGTIHDLCVVDRTGVLTRMPRVFSAHSGKFLMRTSWCIARAKVDQFLEDMKGYEYLNNEELNFLMSSIIRQRRSYQDIVASLDYEIDQSKFTSTNQSVYFTNQDIVVSTLIPSQTPTHPYCISSTPSVEDIGVDMSDENNAYIKIEYIDNTGKLGDRYVNLCGTVQKLTPKQCLDLNDGIYLYTRTKKINTTDQYCIEKDHVVVEDAEKLLGIYKTHEEAEYGGDPKNGVKLKLLDAEREVTQLKHDLTVKNLNIETLVADAKIKETDYKALRDDLQRTHDLLKASEENRRLIMTAEANNKKHELDMRVMNRKESFETLKLIPGIVVVVGGIIIAVLKTKGSGG